MEKKKYVKPSIKVYKMEAKTSLLQSSSGGGNGGGMTFIPGSGDDEKKLAYAACHRRDARSKLHLC